jgi:pimeloyl-ACP methyl ester carboxylesterase
MEARRAQKRIAPEPLSRGHAAREVGAPSARGSNENRHASCKEQSMKRVHGSFLLGGVLAWLSPACHAPADDNLGSASTASETFFVASALPPGRTIKPIRVERLDASEPAVFVVRGSGIGPGKLVFLHGMCGHGLGYAQSFQHAAAQKGTLIAPQADVVCGDGPGAKWSMDIAALDARIVAAFHKLGNEVPIRDICVLGMSQGATRAAALARTFPERYTRLISMGAPTEVKAAGLERLRAAVFMVGQRERKDLMLASEKALKRSGVPVKSLIIPEADHAGMGPTPEQTMGAALDWIWENSRPPAEKP